ILERLPEGIDGWYFLRGTRYLRLSFCGEAAALRELLVPCLRSWAGGVPAPLLLGRAGPPPWPAAVALRQADSDAVLAQMRLARAGALTVSTRALCAAGLADVERAFRGAAGVRPPRNLAMLTPWWLRRAEALAGYGAEVRRRAEPDASAREL